MVMHKGLPKERVMQLVRQRNPGVLIQVLL